MIESPRHDLDEVIDRVAAKMVAVPDGAGMLSRTLARLPERTATPWFLALPAQLAAGVALLLVAFLYARPSREVVSIATVPVADRTPVTVAPPQLAVAPTPGPRLRQGYGGQALIPDPRSPIPDRPDHERSLPAVDAVEAIELAGIATPSIDVESAAAIEPIVLTELALEPEGDL